MIMLLLQKRYKILLFLEQEERAIVVITAVHLFTRVSRFPSCKTTILHRQINNPHKKKRPVTCRMKPFHK